MNPQVIYNKFNRQSNSPSYPSNEKQTQIGEMERGQKKIDQK